METLPSIRFPAMGSVVDVTVLGGVSSTLFELAQKRIEDLEQKWSRFRPDTELTLLCDAAAHGAVERVVSNDTCLLFDHGVYAWRMTNGRFDPSVRSTMVASGYDRSFELLRPSNPLPKLSAAPGCAGIRVNHEKKEVFLPKGVGFDPGGIGKGFAADLVVEDLLSAGALGACVNVGGDLRVLGEAPGDGWPVGVANPFLDDDLVSVVLLHDQGLAMSNRLIRRWQAGDEERNHLIDPSTGASASGAVATAVIAGHAWWSEVLAKVGLLDPEAATVVPSLGGAALIIYPDQHIDAIGGYEHFERPRD